MVDDHVRGLVEALRQDARVRGVAQLFDAADLPDYRSILVVATWDGCETLPAALPGVMRAAFGDVPVRTSESWPGKYAALGSDGTRIELQIRGAGELKPSDDGRHAVPLHDPQELIAQWARYCDAAPAPPSPRPDQVQRDARMMMGADLMLRTPRRGRMLPALLDPAVVRHRLDAADPVESALAARIDAHLATEPLAAEGVRVVTHGPIPPAFDAFLSAADGEGFKGDRVLFGEATKRLRDLSKREPVFDQGFVVPTFDAVEAAFALGEAVGGCQPPLIPGVYVGVGVTPNDALEFWAAPFVRDPTCSVACVDDAGERDVVERAAGREPMVATLTSAVDAAWERLPALIDRARDGAKEQVDPAAVLAKLHLPRSFVERARRRGAGALMCSRLTVALAVARAGHDCAPLVARKFGLAAGRVLAAH